MIQKSCIHIMLLLGMILLNLIVGCNGETDKPLEPTETEEENGDLPGLSKEDLVGTWIVVSKDGENFEDVFVATLVDDIRNRFQNVTQKITANSWVFAVEGSWTWELAAEILAGEEDIFFKLDINLVQKGRYELSTETFSLMTDNVEIAFKPKDLLQLAGIKEATLREALAQRASVPMKSTWDLQENLFTLTAENSEEIVLSKQ